MPMIFNWSVPGQEKLFNVRRCTMYTGVQFDRFHCIAKDIYNKCNHQKLKYIFIDKLSHEEGDLNNGYIW